MTVLLDTNSEFYQKFHQNFFSEKTCIHTGVAGAQRLESMLRNKVHGDDCDDCKAASPPFLGERGEPPVAPSE